MLLMGLNLAAEWFCAFHPLHFLFFFFFFMKEQAKQAKVCWAKLARLSLPYSYTTMCVNNNQTSCTILFSLIFIHLSGNTMVNNL